MLRGGIPRPKGKCPDSLSQAILAWIILLGRLCERCEDVGMEVRGKVQANTPSGRDSRGFARVFWEDRSPPSGGGGPRKTRELAEYIVCCYVSVEMNIRNILLRPRLGTVNIYIYIYIYIYTRTTYIYIYIYIHTHIS